MGYAAVGVLNFTAYAAYVASALTLGHLGDRMGFKRPLAWALMGLAVVLLSGFFWLAPWMLFVSACGINVFYGYFYPTVEGLLSRMERAEGVHPYSTTARYSLSWSSGNILGMVFGPWLIQNHGWMVFSGGTVLCFTSAALLTAHERKHRERVPVGGRLAFRPGPELAASPERLASLRLGARVALLAGSTAFFGAMLLYPKILSDTGVPLAQVGLIAAFGNLAVFGAFLVLLPARFWIGRPGLCALLSSGLLLLYGLAFFLTKTPALFALTAVVGGLAYAVPYTFALFYGLSTPDADHARQGAIHETLIGVSLGLGPLMAGCLLSLGRGPWILGAMVLALGLVSLAVQAGLFLFRRSA
jgi:predicted MFS family arabinose efflux permease